MISLCFPFFTLSCLVDECAFCFLTFVPASQASYSLQPLPEELLSKYRQGMQPRKGLCLGQAWYLYSELCTRGLSVGASVCPLCQLTSPKNILGLFAMQSSSLQELFLLLLLNRSLVTKEIETILRRASVILLRCFKTWINKSATSPGGGRVLCLRWVPADPTAHGKHPRLHVPMGH